ncbi:MAG TPA: hypothetical protein PKA37_00190 [Planctomycetota bacterium]|nr:hypothetical protein [Planctomycetota bacterium]
MLRKRPFGERTLVLLCGAFVLLAALFLLPHSSDGAYAANDALWFGRHAEVAPLQGVVGHHPLFHFLVNALTSVLRTSDIDHPGHHAVRLLAGLAGVCWLALLAITLRGRPVVILLCAIAPVLLSRGFLFETAVGENVVPAGAGAAALFVLAARGRDQILGLGIATVAVLLLRQDNLLFIPALLLLLRYRATNPIPFSRLVPWVACVGLCTLCLYYGIYWITQVGTLADRAPTFLGWMFKLVGDESGFRSWNPEGVPWITNLKLHMAALGWALFGVQSFDAAFPIMLGLSYLSLSACALFLIGRSIGRQVSLYALVAILLLRMPFFTLVEAQNFEWWVPTMMVTAALLVSSTAWLPEGSLRGLLRWALYGLLVLGAFSFTQHVGPTCQLRSTKMHEDAVQALALLQANQPCSAIALGHVAATAWSLRGITPQVIEGEGEVALQKLHEIVVAKGNRPAVLLLDRFVYNGQPAIRRLREDHYSKTLDEAPARPGDVIYRREGRITVIGLDAKDVLPKPK